MFSPISKSPMRFSRHSTPNNFFFPHERTHDSGHRWLRICRGDPFRCCQARQEGGEEGCSKKDRSQENGRQKDRSQEGGQGSRGRTCAHANTSSCTGASRLPARGSTCTQSEGGEDREEGSEESQGSSG